MALLMVGFMAPTLQAQHCDGHNARKAEHIQMMKEKLGLSDQQIQQMEAVHEDARAQMKAIWMDENMDDDTRFQKAHALMESKHAQIASILTDEQKEKMQALHEEMGEHHGKGMHMRPGGPFGHGGKGMKAHHRYMKTFFQENIMPMVKAQRAKFETKLSAADKASIEVLRGELEAMKPEWQAMRKQMKAAKLENGEITPAQKEYMRGIRVQKRDIMKRALAIAEKYEDDLKAMHEEMRPKIEAMHKELMTQMHAKMKEMHGGGDGGGALKGEGCEKGKPHHGKHGMHGHHGPRGHHGMMHGPGERFRKMKAARFILMDPDATAELEPSEELFEGSSAEAPSFEVFPNPSVSQNKVSYEIQHPGNVRVELMTKDGRIVKVLANGPHEAGSYSIDVDVAALDTDLYYYRIVEEGGVRTKRFTIVK